MFSFSLSKGMDQSETDTDSETPMGHASIWVQTHTIFYRPVPDNDPCNYASPNAAKNTGAPNVLLPCGSASGTRKGKGANGKSSNKKKGDDLWIGNKLNLFCPIRERRINVLI
jgi:E3 ubiquitin-protein ligase TRIP12